MFETVLHLSWVMLFNKHYNFKPILKFSKFWTKCPGGSNCILEYLSQANNITDLINEDLKFKFIDDLSFLEILKAFVLSIWSPM